MLIGPGHLKIAGKSNNYQFYLPKFLTFCDNISYKLLRPSQSWKKFWKFWNVSICRIKSSHSPLLNVAVYWNNYPLFSIPKLLITC